MSADIERELELIDAAEAVVARWYTPKWKDEPHTAVFIDRLRAAVEQARAPTPQAPTAQPLQRRAPSTAEHDIGMAHIICDEAGIPPGEIIRRLTALSGKADKATRASAEAPTSAVAEPVLFQWRVRDMHPMTVTTGQLSDWANCDRAHYDACKHYRDNGYPHYEVRALIVAPAAPLPAQENTCPSCEHPISAHAWNCLFQPQNIDAEAADQIPLPSRSTGFSCPVCCAKAGEPCAEGCNAQALPGDAG